jgi:hypothetical protein
MGTRIHPLPRLHLQQPGEPEAVRRRQGVKEDPELTQEDDFDDELVPNSTRESARLVHFNSLSLREGERPSRTHLAKMESCITSPRKAVLLLTTTRT